MISRSLSDFERPGVVIEVDAGEAESLGAFYEGALSAADALDANLDVEAD